MRTTRRRRARRVAAKLVLLKELGDLRFAEFGPDEAADIVDHLISLARSA
jgi:hypothetical protein